jgi:hypothetical protein
MLQDRRQPASGGSFAGTSDRQLNRRVLRKWSILYRLPLTDGCTLDARAAVARRPGLPFN